MVDELYRLYIVPWASARGVFRFKAGLTRAGFRFLQVYALTRAGDFKFFQVFAPLCGPLRRDSRAFPAGVILSPLCLRKRASPPPAGLCGGYPGVALFSALFL